METVKFKANEIIFSLADYGDSGQGKKIQLKKLEDLKKEKKKKLMKFLGKKAAELINNINLDIQDDLLSKIIY